MAFDMVKYRVRGCSFVLLVISGLITAGCQKQPTNTLSALQGEWMVRASNGDPKRGHVFSALVGRTVLIKGDTLAFTDFMGSELRTIKVGPSAPICTIDIDGPPKRWKRLGVFQVEGDRWTLSVNFPQNARPSDFKNVNDGREVVVLDRVPR